VGWTLYRPQVGYGWCGLYIEQPCTSYCIPHYARSSNGGNIVQQTYIYDDYANLQNDFHFTIENGVYNVNEYIPVIAPAFASAVTATVTNTNSILQFHRLTGATGHCWRRYLWRQPQRPEFRGG
jgi:hypothetical protein